MRQGDLFHFSSLRYLTFPQIEQWCEHHYPSFVMLSAPAGEAHGGKSKPQVSVNPADARSRVVLLEEKSEKDFSLRRRIHELRTGQPLGNPPTGTSGDGAVKEIVMYLLFAFVGMGGLCMGIVWLILKFFVQTEGQGGVRL
jgi:farnesyl-diphosphate farnesyltransferase